VRRLRMTARRLGGSAAGVIVLVGLFAAPSGAASPVVPSISDLVPSVVTDGRPVGFVTGGRKALYTAAWTNQSNATLTNILIRITLPPGSTVLSADPDVCTAPAPPSPTDPVVVSCPRDNLRSGNTFAQRIFFQTAAVAAETQFVVMSLLQGDEQVSDPNKAHNDTFSAPDRPVRILPTSADAAGGCIQTGDAALATQSGLSSTNPLITAASLTGPTGLFCTPVTLVEQHRSSPTEGCGAGATCTIDIAVSFVAPPAPSSAIQLTFTFIANNRNLTWYKNTVPVADCLGATRLPDDLDACVNSRSKLGSMAVSLGVLWGGGPDPSWTG